MLLQVMLASRMTAHGFETMEYLFAEGANPTSILFIPEPGSETNTRSSNEYPFA